MPFDISNKVAVITGGAGGIGFATAKELLKNNAKGIVIADIDAAKGEEAVEELNGLFEQDKAVFIKTDTSSIEDYEKAFQLAVDRFGHVDILLNNAAILNDQDWEKSIKVNINGYLHGIILAMETYLRNFKSTDEAVILNTCSIVACEIQPHFPFYLATKFAVMGMTRAWGDLAHFERTKVRVLAVCPGSTDTTMIPKRKVFRDEYTEMKKAKKVYKTQSAGHVGKEMVNLLKEGGNGSLWIVEENLPGYEYILPDKKEFKRQEQ